MENSSTVQEIIQTLSAARFSTYAKAATDDNHALSLYQWNIEISKAIFGVLGCCEIALRNTISAALQAQYGSQWAWHTGFERSLPSPKHGYKPREALIEARKNTNDINNVIAKLNFAFWQHMLTARHDDRIWSAQFYAVFCGINTPANLAKDRSDLFKNTEHLRRLRNRIAHHEPIFNQNLAHSHQVAINTLQACSPALADWVQNWQNITFLLNGKPSPNSKPK
ncbi:hypothetical protein B0181_04485 [Moraxella caviae]|uniref:Abi-like protein n=1 Tax=Moraxella caviae TaxID=34060 RepID=A0A1T0A505_9GAMM|nr:Abi family protein [Moraxella caviae]OOR90853.1 hypothetical protein B0181_04485 [Moraxella caviae]STZ10688.1 Abi-like protein [Moraxella caviae]VEW10860.1 Abi-like protein [Moraxella caviae]